MILFIYVHVFWMSRLAGFTGSSAFQENCLNSDVVEQIYKRNPILRHTHHPLHSPLLPLPYGDINLNRESPPRPRPAVLGTVTVLPGHRLCLSVQPASVACGEKRTVELRERFSRESGNASPASELRVALICQRIKSLVPDPKNREPVWQQTNF